MPLLLQTADLKSGMRLARPLLVGHKLVLPQDRVLSNADVDALNRRYPGMQVAVADPLLDDAVSFQDDTRDAAVSTYVQRQFRNAIQHARDTLKTSASLGGMDFRAIETAIVEIVRFLRKNPVTWALLAENSSGQAAQFADQTSNVFYLAMVMGNAVRGFIMEARRNASRYGPPTGWAPPPNLTPLGLAALLRDISLWGHYATIDHDGPLTTDERELVLKHPLTSAAALPEDTSPHTVDAVRDHHENFNGTGYPRRKSGRSIALFARILRIADAYTAAVSSRPYRAGKSPVCAFWEMTCGPYAPFYDPVILKVFQSVVQPYPIGAKVRLASGHQAVVVRHGRLHGLLPEVIIAYDSDDRPLPRHALQCPHRLDEHPEIRIVSFAGEDLSGIYGNEPIYYDDSPPPPFSFETLLESSYP
jgi:hypothetical protein